MEILHNNTKMEAVIYIYESEVMAIAGEAQRFPSSETGGDLFGTFTHGNMPVVWLASGPGPNAKHFSTHFEQDARFTSEWQRRLMKDFGIQYVGSWHSHHTLALNQPSGGDMRAATAYAVRHGRQRTLEIIANHEGRVLQTALRPYFYPRAQEGGWIPAEFSALERESPLRSLLGTNERLFSDGLDWRHQSLKSHKLATYQRPHNSHEVPQEDGTHVPSELQHAIERLESQSVDVEQRGHMFMVVIEISGDRMLAVAMDNSDGLKIVQANVIDQVANTNVDITSRLSAAGIPFSINRRNVEVLREAVSLVEKARGI